MKVEEWLDMDGQVPDEVIRGGERSGGRRGGRGRESGQRIRQEFGDVDEGQIKKKKKKPIQLGGEVKEAGLPAAEVGDRRVNEPVVTYLEPEIAVLTEAEKYAREGVNFILKKWLERKGIEVKVTDKFTHEERDMVLDDLDGGDEESAESQAAFQLLARELFKESAVHGISKPDKGDPKKTIIMPETDLDGWGAVLMYQMAGISTKDLVFVPQGEVAVGRQNLDTGNGDGVETRQLTDVGGALKTTGVDDHHGPTSGGDTSATRVSYEKLVALGLLEKSEKLDRLVAFITASDNGEMPGVMPEGEKSEWYKTKYSRTPWGLGRYLNKASLEKILADGADPMKPLSREQLRKYGLSYRPKGGREVDRTVSVQEVVNSDLLQLAIARREGRELKVEIGGKEKKILVDWGGELKNGPTTCRMNGVDIYIKWNDGKGFQITSNDLIPELPEGRSVRGRLWIRKPDADGEAMSLKLDQVLEALAGHSVDVGAELSRLMGVEYSQPEGKVDGRRFREMLIEASKKLRAGAEGVGQGQEGAKPEGSAKGKLAEMIREAYARKS